MPDTVDPGLLSAVSAAVAQTPPMAAEQKSGIKREPGDVPEAERENVERLCSEIKADKAHWRDAFERMRYDMRFVAGKNQWPNQKKKETRYIANITRRHIQQRVASVYAKNPTAVVKRRERLKFQVWDGNPESYMLAQQFLAQAVAAGVPPPPGAALLLQDVETAAAQDAQIDRIGETARIMFHYFLQEQEPSFKKGMKRVVRRAKTMGVGYVRVGFQRVNGRDPKDEQGLIDAQRRLDRIKQLRADLADGVIDPYCAEAEQLEQQVKNLLAKPEIVLREGLVFDFPDPLRVIPHRCCTQLDGFLGAQWVTVEHVMTLDRIKQVYNVDISGNFQAYARAGDGRLIPAAKSAEATEKAKGDKLALVWQHYHRPSGLMYTVVDGYPSYLSATEEPDVDLERFFPIYAYVTNELDEEDDTFPASDVQILAPIQIEYNRRREAERQHRIANRPLYVGSASNLPAAPGEEDPIKTLANAPAHGIVALQALAPGQKAEDLLSPMKKIGLDPSVYEVESVFVDSQRVVGSQEVDFGGVSGGTATEVGIADAKRLTSEQDDIDMLDMLLSDLARDSTKIMLKEISPETAKRIAGPGAVWPQLNRQQIAEELILDVEAGSSGRPNRLQEIANMERMAQTVLQTPGINPTWWAKRLVKTIDPTVDLSEAITEGLPAMLSLNKQAQPSTGDAETDPNAQGEEGGENEVKAGERPPGPQPGFPTAGTSA